MSAKMRGEATAGGYFHSPAESVEGEAQFQVMFGDEVSGALGPFD